MFMNIFSFELRYRAKKTSTYIYFILFLLFGFWAVFRGSFGSGPLRILGNIGIINANSPYVLYYMITIMSHCGLLITAAFFGNAAYRDFKENTHGLYFSYPIRKINYFTGRFFGAFFSTLFVFSGAGIGAFLGSIVPFSNPEKIGQINVFAYIQPYLIGVLPNILLAGAVFFSVVLTVRKFIPIYVCIVALLSSHLLGVSLMQTLDTNTIASLVDPFGHIAAGSISDLWTPAQKNVLLIPLAGNYLSNRILWIILSTAVLIIAYKRFHFSHIIETKKQKKRYLKQIIKRSQEMPGTKIENFKKNDRIYNFKFKNNIQQMLYTVYYEFSWIVKNISFLIILILGVVFIFIMSIKNVGLTPGIQTNPITHRILETTKFTLYIFNLIVILFCSGELIWRERNKKVHEAYDVMPIPEWVPFMGKLGALILLQLLIMMMVMLSGILIQLLHGYHHFEIGLYLKELLGIRLIYYSLISIFAMFMQVIINKKFMGYLITLLLVDDLMPILGLSHPLWRFASIPTNTYSDLNGYGPFAGPIIFYNLYWCSFALLLVVLSILFWVRQKETSFKERVKKAKTRLTRAKIIAICAGFISCIIFGSYIIL